MDDWFECSGMLVKGMQGKCYGIEKRAGEEIRIEKTDVSLRMVNGRKESKSMRKNSAYNRKGMS